MWGIDWLKQEARDWALQVVQLYNTPVPAVMQAEKTQLLQRAKTIKETIEKVTGPLDPLSPLNPIIKQLGALPVVIGGAVGIGAAAAAIAYWLVSYGKFKERIRLNDQLIAEGVTNQAERNRLIDQAAGEKSLSERIFNPQAFLPLALVVVGGLFLWNRRGR